MLDIKVLDKIQTIGFYFLFHGWPCLITHDFIFHFLNFRHEVTIMCSAIHFRNPNAGVCTNTEHNSDQCWSCSYSMEWNNKRIWAEKGKQNNMIIPGSHRGSNCQTVAWSVAKEIQKEYCNHHQPQSSWLSLLEDLIQCTQIMCTSSDTGWL